MKKAISFLILLFALVFAGSLIFLGILKINSKVLGNSVVSENRENVLAVVSFYIDPETKTQFAKKTVQTTKTIPFIIQEIKDDTLEKGKREVKQIGKSGLLTQDFEITFWGNEEYGRQLIKENWLEPVNQIEAVGTKVVIRDLTVGIDTFHYSDIFRMFATSYDGNCRGCSGKTFSGTSVHRGVCAVDPAVIPIGSWLYIDGYGTCKAEDIGGAVKGLRVDLGFEDTSLGGWSAHFATVYLLVP